MSRRKPSSTTTMDHKKHQHQPKPEPREPDAGRELVEAEPARPEDLELVRKEEAGPPTVPAKTGNIFIGTLNVFTGQMGKFVDPVKKVCYEPLQTHWEEKYKKKYPDRAHWVLALDLTLLTVIGALVVGAIFAYFVMPAFPQPQVVTLQTLAPQTIISGAPTELIIAYQNETGGRLAEAVLKVRLPDGFVLDSPAQPAADQAKPAVVQALKDYPLGNIMPHGRGEVRIPGTAYAPVGSRPTLTAELYFWREGATEPTRVATYNEWPVTDALLGLSVRVEDAVIRGRQSAVTITYANKSEAALPSAVVRLTPPDDFTVTGSSPRMTGQNEWKLTDIEAGGKGAIEVYGILRSGAGKGAVPNFTVRGYLVQDGARHLVQEVRQNIDALTTGFELTQEVGKPAGKMSLNPGEETEVVVRYRNGGPRPMVNVKIQLEPTARYLADEADAYSWDSSNTPALARLEPGATGSVTAKLKLKDTIDAAVTGGDQHPMLETKAWAQYFMAEDLTRPIYADTAVISLPFATRLGLKASALYYTKDGEQLGIGPLPPQAGQTTKYWVFLYVTNTTNAVRDARLEAFLPPEASWTGRYSVTSGQPTVFLPATGQVVWDIGAVPEFADGGGTRVGASFEVAVKPGKGAIGTVPVLLKDIKLTGTDTVTGSKIFAAAPDVTAILPFGSPAAKEGKVIK